MKVFQQDVDNSINETKSEYELLRDLKIARNQKRLAELGLLNLGKPLIGVAKEGKKPKKRKQNGESGGTQKPIFLRRSQRILFSEAVQQTSNNHNTPIVSHEEEQEEEKMDENPSSTTRSPSKKTKSYSANRQKSLMQMPTIPTDGKISTRFLDLNVNEVIASFLGQQLEISGKDAVISQMSRFSSHNNNYETTKSTRISFNKYSGVLEWKNALFLWVNLTSNGSTICNKSNNQANLRNDFFDNGRFITWFGGSKMDEETPAIQRLIEVQTTASSEEHDAVILWVRYNVGTSSSLSPYVCLGRCGYKSHIHGSQPLRFTLSLLDYDRLMCKEGASESILKRILLHDGIGLDD